MPLEVQKTGRSEPLFMHIHSKQAGNELEIEVTLAIEASIERMIGAFYMDGSDSMRGAGNFGRRGGLFGLGKQRNLVEEAMRVAVPYVVNKDANGSCRVCYWATGANGRAIELLGEMTTEQAQTATFSGPKVFGGSTYLLPAIRDFVAYIQEIIKSGETVGAALAVIVTDGQFHDQGDVIAYVQGNLAPTIMEKKFPRTVFSLVGIGSQVDEEQLEDLLHEATPEEYPYREVFCYALAETLDQLPILVNHLLDENTPAFYGGATITAHEQTVMVYEDMVPAILTFKVPLKAREFTLNADGKSFRQTFDLVESDHDE